MKCSNITQNPLRRYFEKCSPGFSRDLELCEITKEQLKLPNSTFHDCLFNEMFKEYPQQKLNQAYFASCWKWTCPPKKGPFQKEISSFLPLSFKEYPSFRGSIPVSPKLMAMEVSWCRRLLQGVELWIAWFLCWFRDVPIFFTLSGIGKSEDVLWNMLVYEIENDIYMILVEKKHCSILDSIFFVARTFLC